MKNLLIDYFGKLLKIIHKKRFSSLTNLNNLKPKDIQLAVKKKRKKEHILTCEKINDLNDSVISSQLPD